MPAFRVHTGGRSVNLDAAFYSYSKFRQSHGRDKGVEFLDQGLPVGELMVLGERATVLQDDEFDDLAHVVVILVELERAGDERACIGREPGVRFEIVDIFFRLLLAVLKGNGQADRDHQAGHLLQLLPVGDDKIPQRLLMFAPMDRSGEDHAAEGGYFHIRHALPAVQQLNLVFCLCQMVHAELCNLSGLSFGGSVHKQDTHDRSPLLRDGPRRHRADGASILSAATLRHVALDQGLDLVRCWGMCHQFRLNLQRSRSPMSAFVIVDTKIKNAEAYEGYKAEAKPIVEKYGGAYRARGGTLDVVENDLWSPTRIVIIEFPDMKCARDFVDSEEYAPVKAIRHANADCSVVIVEGI